MTIHRSVGFSPAPGADERMIEQQAFLDGLLDVYAYHRRLMLSGAGFNVPTNLRIDLERREDGAIRAVMYVGGGIPKGKPDQP